MYVESDRTIATVSFPLKSALQQNDAKNDTGVPVNVPVNLTERTAGRITKALREIGILHIEGSDKSGFWVI